MVTQIIKQQDIHPDYNKTNHWIEFGITNDAGYLLIHKWIIKNKRDCCWSTVVNKIYGDPEHRINNLTKW